MTQQSPHARVKSNPRSIRARPVVLFAISSCLALRFTESKTLFPCIKKQSRMTRFLPTRLRVPAGRHDTSALLNSFKSIYFWTSILCRIKRGTRFLFPCRYLCSRTLFERLLVGSGRPDAVESRFETQQISFGYGLEVVLCQRYQDFANAPIVYEAYTAIDARQIILNLASCNLRSTSLSVTQLPFCSSKAFPTLPPSLCNNAAKDPGRRNLYQPIVGHRCRMSSKQ